MVEEGACVVEDDADGSVCVGVVVGRASANFVRCCDCEYNLQLQLMMILMILMILMIPTEGRESLENVRGSMSRVWDTRW